VILVNIALMAAEAESKEVRAFTKEVGIFEFSFVAFFSFEVALRIYVHGFVGFFCNEEGEERHWNWIDSVIVSMGLLALVIRPSKSGFRRSDGDNEWSSCLLLLRGLRIIRVIRLFKGLRQLHMLVRGMFKSFEAVFWILVLGFLIILLFAVSVTTIVGIHSNLWSVANCGAKCGPEDQERIQELFGNLTASMWTMFQFVTLDDWAEIIHLVAKRLWVMRFFFLAYTLIASFALISLLTGVMAEHIMSESQETAKANGDEDIKQYIDMLQTCFMAKQRASADLGEGLSLDQLTVLLSDKKVSKYLKRLGLSNTFRREDAEDAFQAMDLDGNGVLSWDEFNKGLKSISGPATAREVALVRADVQRMLRSRPSSPTQSRILPGIPLEQVSRAQRLRAAEEVSSAQRLGAVEERLARIDAAVVQLVQSSKQEGSSNHRSGPLEEVSSVKRLTAVEERLAGIEAAVVQLVHAFKQGPMQGSRAVSGGQTSLRQ